MNSTSTVIISPGNSLDVIASEADLLEFLQLNVAGGDASHHTLRSYVTHIGQFVVWCRESNVSPAHATPGDLKRYRRYMVRDREFSRATIGVKLSAIRRLYDALVESGACASNPVAKVGPPPSRQTRADQILKTAMSVDEVALLLSGPDTSMAQGSRDLLILGMLYYHGLRVSEVVKLSLETVKVTSGTLTVFEGKGKKTRILYLVETTKKLVSRWLDLREIFTNRSSGTALLLSMARNRTGQPLTVGGARFIVNGYIKAAGLYWPGRGPHSLRHSHGTHASAAGVQLAELAAEMGHASPKTTMGYIDAAARGGPRSPASLLESVQGVTT